MAGPQTTRTASVAVLGLVAVGLWLVASATGAVAVTGVMALAGLLLAVAVLLRAGDTPAQTAASTALVPIAALAFAAGLGLVVADRLGPTLAGGAGPVAAVVGLLFGSLVPLGVGLGAWLAVLGAVGTFRAGLGERETLGAFNSAVVTVLLLGTVGAVVAALALWRELEPLEQFPSELTVSEVTIALGDPRLALLATGLMLVPVGYAGQRSIRSLPLSQLAPHQYRDLTEAIERDADTVFGWAFLGGILLAGGVGIAWATGLLTPAFAEIPALQTVATLLVAFAVPWGLLALSVVFAAVYAVMAGVQRLTGRVAGTIAGLVPDTVGAIGLAALAVLAGSARPTTGPAAAALEATLAGLPPFVDFTGLVLAGLGAAVALLATALFGLIVLGAFGLVPGRSTGSALAGGGLGLGAVVVALVEGPPLVIFAVVSLAVVAWDVGAQGVTAHAQLGRGERSVVRVEAVHWLVSLGVAGAGAIAAWVALGVVRGLPPTPDSPFRLAGLGIVVLSLMLLASVLRR